MKTHQNLGSVNYIQTFCVSHRHAPYARLPMPKLQSTSQRVLRTYTINYLGLLFARLVTFDFVRQSGHPGKASATSKLKFLASNCNEISVVSMLTSHCSIRLRKRYTIPLCNTQRYASALGVLTEYNQYKRKSEHKTK